MAANAREVTTPSSTAMNTLREKEHQMLIQIDGVGNELASVLLDAFGSLYGIQQAAASHWGSLTEVEGISENVASGFFDRMSDAGVMDAARKVSPDGYRRAQHAEMYRRTEDGHTGEFAIVDVSQVLAGMAVPALRVKFEPTTSAYDPPSGETPTLTTRIPQGTQAYRAYLKYLELPSNAWGCSPIEIAQQYRDRIEGRTVPFDYQNGFVVKLRDGNYQV